MNGQNPTPGRRSYFSCACRYHMPLVASFSCSLAGGELVLQTPCSLLRRSQGAGSHCIARYRKRCRFAQIDPNNASTISESRPRQSSTVTTRRHAHFHLFGMTTHVGILPIGTSNTSPNTICIHGLMKRADVLHTLCATLQPEQHAQRSVVAGGLPFLRLPHPRTGTPELFNHSLGSDILKVSQLCFCHLTHLARHRLP
jgi:hypothetical protein